MQKSNKEGGVCPAQKNEGGGGHAAIELER